MINLNKIIIAGTFILLIIFLFHSHIKEGFIDERENSIVDMIENEYSQKQRERKNGSSKLTVNLLNTVSAHLQNLHIEKTIDLVKNNSYIAGNADDGTKGKIDFSPLNQSQVSQLNDIEHINKLNNAVKQSIKFHESNPTRENVLRGVFGN